MTLFLWLALITSTAFADVPPPEGYVETCTIEAACAGREGRTCEGYHGGREPCEALEKEGFVRACQTRGASVWTEVMCKPADGASGGAAAPAEPTPTTEPTPPAASGAAPAAPATESRGCATVPSADVAPGGCKCASAGGAPLSALLVGVAALFRRRRAPSC